MATYPPSDSEPRSGGYRGAPPPSHAVRHRDQAPATAGASSPHRLHATHYQLSTTNSQSGKDSASPFSEPSVLSVVIHYPLPTTNSQSGKDSASPFVRRT